MDLPELTCATGRLILSRFSDTYEARYVSTSPNSFRIDLLKYDSIKVATLGNISKNVVQELINGHWCVSYSVEGSLVC